eukprot:gene43558-53256_t
MDATGALSLALEAGRTENEALRISYNYLHAQYAQLHALYRNVYDKLSTEGGVLTEREQKKMRQLQQDLQDFRIYKEVCEQTLLKLTSEINALVKKNAQLEKQLEDERRRARAGSAASASAGAGAIGGMVALRNEVTELRKRAKELAARLADSEERERRANKERDIAVHTLASLRGGGGRAEHKAGDASRDKDSKDKDKEKEDKGLAERLRALEAEREAILTAHEKEVSGLRSAHAQALEKLLGCQEEVDGLKAMVRELSKDKAEKMRGVQPN